MIPIIKGFIMEFFKNKLNQWVKAGTVGDWVSEQLIADGLNAVFTRYDKPPIA